jgi:hypothetical protein
MAMQPLDIKLPETSESSPESGVIRDARRHRRRERTVASLLVFALIAAVLVLVIEGNSGQPARPRSSQLTWLAGAPLHKPTNLRLIVSGNTPGVSIVDVDSGQVSTVRGLGLPHRYSLQGPMIWSLTPATAGATAITWRQSCGHCVTLTSFRIGADGSARRTTSVTIGRHQQSTQATESTTGIWVLTQQRFDRCTLKLEPGSRPAVAAPCGTLGADTAAGLVLQRGGDVTLVNPWTGRVRERLAIGTGGQFDFLGHHIGLIGSSPGDGASSYTLTLVNLATGARTHLRWPSNLRFGYSVIRDPRAPLVAINFGDPADPGPRQASDLWLLNLHTGRFTHLPGYPIFEDLKSSGAAWTTDGRLVIAAQRHARTAVAVYRPGSSQLQLGRVPRLGGYSQMVPLIR